MKGIDYATEVAPGLVLGGFYSDTFVTANDLEVDAVIDLTCGFPERIRCREYLCLPIWDGNAPTTNDLNCAVQFAKTLKKKGVVVVHCAFGVGNWRCATPDTPSNGQMKLNYRQMFPESDERRILV